jgi:predicted RND superfamily exporter protein
VWLTGPPAGEAAIAAALATEQRRIVPLVCATLFLLLLAVYRSFGVALGALLPALGAIAWTGALQERLGLAIDPVTALLPPVVLAVGVAGAVHMVDAFLDARAHGLGPDPASRRAWRAVLAPALGCAATTVAGFLALCTSPIAAIGRFGGLAAAGVVATALLTFLALPPWLRLAARSARLARRDAWHGRWRTASAVIARVLARQGRVLVAVALGAALLLGRA